MIPEMVPWAIVPAAGRGTRLRPVTAAVPKVLLPVGTRPMLQWAIDEAIDAGVDGVIVVIGEDGDAVRAYLERARSAADGGDSGLEVFGRRLRRVELVLVEQPAPLGVGDAFVRCRGVTGTDPFAALLPDNWFDATEPPIRQIYDTFERCGLATLALTEIRPEQAPRYGNVGGVELDEIGGRSYRIRFLQDKRRGTFEARENGAELRGCARYLLGPDFYDALEATGPPRRDEWDDVPAFQYLIDGPGVAGHRVEGVHFDLGQPAGYLAAQAHLAAAAYGGSVPGEGPSGSSQADR